jgi:hypothetical protein
MRSIASAWYRLLFPHGTHCRVSHEPAAVCCNHRVRSLTAALIALCTVTSHALNGAAQATIEGGRTVLAAVVNAQGRPVVDIGVDDVVVSEGSASREVL